MGKPPKRRKLRRTMRLPLHAVPEREQGAAVPPCPVVNRVLRRDSAARLVIDAALAINLQEQRR